MKLGPLVSDSGTSKRKEKEMQDVAKELVHSVWEPLIPEESMPHGFGLAEDWLAAFRVSSPELMRFLIETALQLDAQVSDVVKASRMLTVVCGPFYHHHGSLPRIAVEDVQAFLDQPAAIEQVVVSAARLHPDMPAELRRCKQSLGRPLDPQKELVVLAVIGAIIQTATSLLSKPS